MTSGELYRLAQAFEEISCSAVSCADDVWVSQTIGPMPAGVPSAAAIAVIDAIAALLHGLPVEEVRIRANAAAQRLRRAAADRIAMESTVEEELETVRAVER